jgi:hypothetical protein
MKAGIGGFAWLTILSGWGMALTYVIILVRTLTEVLRGRAGSSPEVTS